LGICYVNGQGVRKDVPKGLAFIKEAADNHYAEAEFTLGYYYHYGYEKVKSNTPEAIKLYLRAVSNGCNKAAANLLGCHQEGLYDPGVDQLIALATILAKQGIASFQNQLGCLYLEKKEMDNAIIWFELASRQQEATAYFNLYQCYTEKGNVPRAKICLALAARLGDDDAKAILSKPIPK
jgi:TPR repeat protein